MSSKPNKDVKKQRSFWKINKYQCIIINLLAAKAALNKHKAQQHHFKHHHDLRLSLLWFIIKHQFILCVWNQPKWWVRNRNFQEDVCGIQRSLTKWNWWRLRSDCPGNSQQKGPWKAKMDVPKSHNYISSPSLLYSLTHTHTHTYPHIDLHTTPAHQVLRKSSVFSLKIMHPLASFIYFIFLF